MKKVFILIFFTTVQINYLCAQNEEFKALFIYNVTNFILWPTIEETFTINVLGESPVIEIFKTDPKLKNKKVSGIPIVLKRVDDVPSIGNCQIIYIPSARKDDIASVVKRIGNKPTLIITDDNSGDPVKEGSCINFSEPPGKKMIMQVSKKNIAKHGLKVDSQLLYLGIEID